MKRNAGLIRMPLEVTGGKDVPFQARTIRASRGADGGVRQLRPGLYVAGQAAGP